MPSQHPRSSNPADPGSERQRRHTPVRGENGFPWLTLLGFAFLTFNSAMAIYRSERDVGAIAFVVFSYIDLVLLFYCLRQYKKSPPGSPQRDRLKASVWGLTTVLTFSFSYVVMGTAGLTLPMALLVFAIAAAIGIGAFSVFFQQDRLNPLPDEAMLPLVENRIAY